MKKVILMLTGVLLFVLLNSCVHSLAEFLGDSTDYYISRLNTTYKLIDLIDQRDITTFNEFYKALLEDYPDCKEIIDCVFADSYTSYGKKEGNVIVINY